MHAHNLVAGNSKHTEGIVVTQFVFGRKRETYQIVDTFQVAGRDPSGVEGVFIMRHIPVGVPENLLQFTQLQSSQLVPRHGFDFGIKHVPFICSVEHDVPFLVAPSSRSHESPLPAEARVDISDGT